MSDPMTNTEVEDVLASIRRLVSDDNRPTPESGAAASSDRLVLTPALRVTDEVEEKHDVLHEAEDAADASTDTVEEQAIDEQQDDLPKDDAPAFEPAQDVSELADDEDEEADHIDVEDQSEDATASEETPIDLDAVDLDQDTLMSIQDAFDDVDDENSSDDTADSEATPQDEATTLSAKIAALETLIAGRTDDEFEPETAGDGENAGTEPPALAWEDAEDGVSKPEDTPPHVEPVQEPAKTDGAQIFSSDEDVLDEEALRDLVSDIVREELQGALGERITRNVRKLVRREIHRALAAQDLE